MAKSGLSQGNNASSSSSDDSGDDTPLKEQQDILPFADDDKPVPQSDNKLIGKDSSEEYKSTMNQSFSGSFSTHK